MSICEPLASGTLSPDGRWPIAGCGSSRRSRRREPPVSKKKNIGVPRRRSVSDENEGRQNAPFHNEVALFDMRPFCRPSAVPRGSYYFAISPGVAQRCCFTPGYGLSPTDVGSNSGSLPLAFKKRALPSPLNDNFSPQLKTRT